MITETDDTIDSEVDQSQIMLEEKLKEDKKNDNDFVTFV
jgi:hypothetical protein